MSPQNKVPLENWLSEKQYDVRLLQAGMPIDEKESIPHRRSYHELFFLQSGRGEIKIDEQKISLENNTIYCIWDNQIYHSLTTYSRKGFSIRFKKEFLPQTDANMMMVFNSTLFNRVRALNRVTIWSEREKERTTALFQQLVEEARLPASTFGQQQTIQYLLMTILVRIARKASALPFKEAYSKGKNATVFQAFQTLLEENYFLHHNIEFYATALDIKGRKLTNIIRTHTGKTGKQFINEKVIRESKRLLTYTNSSLKEIAIKLGFKNQTYFCYAFKKETEMSPLEYRKKHTSV